MKCGWAAALPEDGNCTQLLGTAGPWGGGLAAYQGIAARFQSIRLSGPLRKLFFACRMRHMP